MDYKLISSSRTEEDIDKSLLWYLGINKELARRFLTDLRGTKDKIHNSLKHFQIRYNNTRITFLKNFPYGFHFHSKKSNDNNIGLVSHARRF